MSDEEDVGLDRDETIEEVDDVDEPTDSMASTYEEDEADAIAIEEIGTIEDLDDRELIKASDKAAKREKAIKKSKQSTPAIKKTVKKVAKKKVVAKKTIKKVVIKKLTPAKKAMDHYVKILKKKVKVKHKHKDKKDKKLGKRGPKGPQWKKWKIPYQEGCSAGQIFLLALHRGGIKIKELQKLCKKTGSNPVRSLKCLRSGHCRGWVWNVDDSHNSVRVTNPRIIDSKWKKK
jgi:hypothetical protein